MKQSTKRTYERRAQEYLDFCDNEPTWDTAKEYRIMLCGREKSREDHWAACRYVHIKLNGKAVTVGKFAEIATLHPFPRREVSRVRGSVSDAQFQKLVEHAEKQSEQIACLMLLIRKMDIKVGQLTALRPSSPNVPDDLRDRCIKAFGSDSWLCGTSSDKPKRPGYIYERISKYSNEVLGIKVGAEALRPAKPDPGSVRLS